MTDTSKLVAEANAISKQSPAVRIFAQDSAANSVLMSQQIAQLQAAVARLQNPPPPNGPTPGTPNGEWWRSDSFWRTKVPNTPPVDQNTNEMMNAMRATQASGFYITGQANGGSGSVPVYHAAANTPTHVVTLLNGGPHNITIPWVSSWKPAPPADTHLAIIQDPTGDYWEFQAFTVTNNSDGSQTLQAHDCATGNVITGDGAAGTRGTPANAISVLPTVGGLVRPQEVSSGVIPHGVRIAISCCSNIVRWPATYSDGNYAGGPPAGAHLWLPRSVPLPTDPWQHMIQTCLQEYGAWVGDSTSGSWADLYVESAADGSAYPFTLSNISGSVLGQMVVLAA